MDRTLSYYGMEDSIGVYGEALSARWQPVDSSGGIRGLALGVIVLSTGLLSYWGNQAIANEVGYVSQGIVAALGIFLLLSAGIGRTSLVFTKEYLLYFFFLVWCIAGYPFAISEYFATIEIVTLFKLFLMALVVLNAVNGRRAYRWFLWAFAVALILASAGGITGIARGASGTETGNWEGRYMGTFGNPNGLGELACMAFWAGLSVFLSTRKGAAKVCMIVVFAVALAMAGWTGSRQALLGSFGLIVGSYWFVIRKNPERKAAGKVVWLLVIAGVILGSVAYLAVTPAWRRLQSMGRETSSEESFQTRKRFLAECYEALGKDPFFGVGVGCTKAIMDTGRARSPHNTLLAIAASTGIPGWLFFYGAFFLGMWRVHKVSKYPLGPEDQPLVLCGWLLYCLLLFFSLTSEMQTYKLYWVSLAGNVGYLVWLEKQYTGMYSSQATETEMSA